MDQQSFFIAAKTQRFAHDQENNTSTTKQENTSQKAHKKHRQILEIPLMLEGNYVDGLCHLKLTINILFRKMPGRNGWNVAIFLGQRILLASCREGPGLAGTVSKWFSHLSFPKRIPQPGMAYYFASIPTSSPRRGSYGRCSSVRMIYCFCPTIALSQY